MKKKILKIAAGIVAFLLIGLILFITNSFVGNPISKAFAQSAIKKYVSENYGNMHLELSKTSYNFKFGNYMATAKSKTSKDTYFCISYSNGKITDNYESDVLGGWNTFLRFDKEYRNAVEPLIRENMPYDFDMVITDLDKSSDGLTLDMEFDLYNMPLGANVTVYIYTDNMSWENVAKVALELDELMRQNNLTIKQYSIILEPVSAKEHKRGETLGVYDFPAELLKSENLADVMKEHFKEWEKDGNAKKESGM